MHAAELIVERPLRSKPKDSYGYEAEIDWKTPTDCNGR